jgi:HSP20 family protein
MPMDAVRHDQHVELSFDLPGVAPESIDVEVERNVLTVSAERTWSPAEGASVLVRERPSGAVTRRVTLGESLDGNRLEASYDAGVLTVTVPVAEQAKPRKVEIHVGAPEAVDAVEAGSQN